MSDQNLGSTTVMQVAIIVKDIEAAARAWAEILGVAVPEVIITDTVDRAHTEYRGRPSEARAKLAFFHLGQVALELVEPIGGPSAWQDHLDQHGESLHHIAFEVKGMADKLSFLASKGIRLLQRGDYSGGRYAYMDSSARLGAA